MNYPLAILCKCLVKRFYRENAGAFVFVFTMMFCIVSKVDGAGLYEYHYSLVTGMLKSSVFLLLVFFLWFLYVRKYVVFVSGAIGSLHYSFLQVYNRLSKIKRLLLFFIIEVLLLMPVLLYCVFIALTGLQQQLYIPVLLTTVYLLLLCITATMWHVYQLDSLNKPLTFPLPKINSGLTLFSGYPFTLLRFVAIKQTNLWAGIKIFTCGTLYLIARNNNAADNDLTMAFLFYNFGILSNGILVLRVRAFEEMYLGFYKAFPVSLVKRFLQYASVYCILLIPEFVTVFMLVPVHLSFKDAVDFTLCGCSLLLLMNSLGFLYNFDRKAYVAILLAVFCIEYIFIISFGFFFLYLFFFLSAIIIFIKQYYKFDYGEV